MKTIQINDNGNLFGFYRGGNKAVERAISRYVIVSESLELSEDRMWAWEQAAEASGLKLIEVLENFDLKTKHHQMSIKDV